MYLIVKLFYLYTPLNLLCKEMRCLNKIIIIIIVMLVVRETFVNPHCENLFLWFDL